MKQTRFRQTRFWIIDPARENKIVYWWSDVEKWLKEYGLEIERQETKYSAEFATTFIYVKPIKTN